MKQVLFITFLSFLTSALIGQVSSKDLNQFLRENPELKDKIEQLHIEKLSNGEFQVYKKEYVFDRKTKVKTVVNKGYLLYILTPILIDKDQLAKGRFDVKYIYQGEFGIDIVDATSIGRLK